jgi:hypothetical protein
MGGREKQKRKDVVVGFLWLALLLLPVNKTTAFEDQRTPPTPQKRNAYVTMLYMGTPRDYDFYVAIRVMFRSLANLHVDADLVVIAALDVPRRWVRAL